jgi:hypothetical protein
MHTITQCIIFRYIAPVATLIIPSLASPRQTPVYHVKTPSFSVVAQCPIYGPECYLMDLTDRSRFLNYSVRMGGGGCGGIRYEFRRLFLGGGRGGGRGAL